MDKLSVVVPCYNEQEALPIFYNEIIKVAADLNQLEFEFIFINDGSKDKTYDLINDVYQTEEFKVIYQDDPTMPLGTEHVVQIGYTG